VEVLLEEGGTVSKLLPLEITPKILFEDEDLLIVDKPSGMVSHPAHGHYRDTAANMAAAYLNGKGEGGPIRLAGRLDRETSGILVFAKNQVAASRLAGQREKGTFRKVYLALASGRMESSGGIIRMPIRKAPGQLMKMETCETDGMNAVTRFRLLRQEKDYSVLALQIETGRTHQIRVHLAWAGHPLLGDRLYGCGDDRIGRAALHAWKLYFCHPFTGEKIQLEAEVPADMIF
jgi:23S rRNA pseudouridine1911/1915/1917 synthase